MYTYLFPGLSLWHVGSRWSNVHSKHVSIPNILSGQVLFWPALCLSALLMCGNCISSVWMPLPNFPFYYGNQTQRNGHLFDLETSVTYKCAPYVMRGIGETRNSKYSEFSLSWTSSSTSYSIPCALVKGFLLASPMQIDLALFQGIPLVLYHNCLHVISTSKAWLPTPLVCLHLMPPSVGVLKSLLSLACVPFVHWHFSHLSCMLAWYYYVIVPQVTTHVPHFIDQCSQLPYINLYPLVNVHAS